jgi:hypothetical protein
MTNMLATKEVRYGGQSKGCPVDSGF